MLENTYFASEWTVKDDFHVGSKGQEETITESLNLLRQYINGHKQKVVRNVQMVKVILMTSQMETRNMLLETEGKVIFVVKWQRAWLSCLYPCVLQKAGIVNNKIGYSAEEITQQSVEKAAWLLLNAYSKEIT